MFTRERKSDCQKLVFDTAVAINKQKSMSKEVFVYQEAHFRVLRLLEVNPQMKQRELAAAAGVSLGKTNYCINALLEKGLIKVQNFKSNKHKLVYAYLLTPAGIAEKADLTQRFLQRKMEEYESLRTEIELLKQEALGSRCPTINLIYAHQSTHE
jgi:EPS-associated MarR family transcriptional regulator